MKPTNEQKFHNMMRVWKERKGVSDPYERVLWLIEDHLIDRGFYENLRWAYDPIGEFAYCNERFAVLSIRGRYREGLDRRIQNAINWLRNNRHKWE